MSIFGTARTDAGRAARPSVGEAFTMMFGPAAPVRFSAYDGSTAGRPDATIHLRLARPRGLAYILGAPTSLGFARAYVAGDLELEGAHPGSAVVGYEAGEQCGACATPGPATRRPSTTTTTSATGSTSWCWARR